MRKGWVAGLPEAQPEVCGAGPAPAAAGAGYPRPGRGALTGAARTLSPPRPAEDETAPPKNRPTICRNPVCPADDGFSRWNPRCTARNQKPRGILACATGRLQRRPLYVQSSRDSIEVGGGE
jgi:hypothetical protein